MKKIVFILCFVGINLFSQHNTSYIKGDICLYIDPFKNKFEISFIDTFEVNLSIKTEHLSPVYEYKPMSKGVILRNDSIIKLYDGSLKRYYSFKVEDPYTLISTKSTSIYKKGEIIKTRWIYNEDYSTGTTMSWKNDKKDGYWFYITNHNRIRSIYSNNILMDSAVWDNNKWIKYTIDKH